MSLDTFDLLLGQLFDMFLRVIWHKEGKCEGSQMSKGCRCGTLLKNQVELIDFSFEGGMRVDEMEEL